MPLKGFPKTLRHAVTLAVLAAPVLAADQEHGAWYLGSVGGDCPGSASGAWNCSLDVQYRTVNDALDFRQRLLRPSLGYRLNNGMELRLGYDRFRTDTVLTDDVSENRYWQQASWAASQWLGGSLGVRARLEQRDVSLGNDLGLRLRLQARYQRPLAGDGRNHVVVSTEPFVNLRDTDWGAQRGFSENRANLLLGRRFNGHFTAEFGYQNQYIRRQAAQDRVNHLVVVGLKYRY